MLVIEIWIPLIIARKINTYRNTNDENICQDNIPNLTITNYIKYRPHWYHIEHGEFFNELEIEEKDIIIETRPKVDPTIIKT